MCFPVGALLHAPTKKIFSFGSLVLVDVVAVFLDVLLNLRAEGLENEEADEAGSGDLAGASAEDLGDRIDDRHEGDEGENDDEHDDAAEGFHCSDIFQRELMARTRSSPRMDSARTGMKFGSEAMLAVTPM